MSLAGSTSTPAGGETADQKEVRLRPKEHNEEEIMLDRLIEWCLNGEKNGVAQPIHFELPRKTSKQIPRQRDFDPPKGRFEENVHSSRAKVSAKYRVTEIVYKVFDFALQPPRPRAPIANFRPKKRRVKKHRKTGCKPEQVEPSFSQSPTPRQ
jgi:hypothetical protein